MTLYTPKDKVFNALCHVYRPGAQEDVEYKWWDGHDRTTMIHVATIEVLDAIAEAHCEPDAEKRKYFEGRLDDEITLRIWNMFPGGTTAEYASNKVCLALGI